MKKIVNIILASALLVSSTTSCSDFLQKDPPSSPSQSIFWQKKSDFQSAIVGRYVREEGDFDIRKGGRLEEMSVSL